MTGAITAILKWLLYADHQLDPLRRSLTNRFDLVNPDTDTMISQIGLQSLGPVSLARSLVCRPDLDFQAGIGLRARGERAFAPSVIPTLRNIQHTTHRRHGILLSQFVDSPVLLREIRRKFF